jgi:transglutaminase-like putative cysteine protease
MRARSGATALLALGVLGIGTAIASRWVVPALRSKPAAPSIASGARYYAVAPDGEPIGFAASAVDSGATGIQVNDYFLADLHTEGTAYRAWARVVARLTPQLELREFVLTLSPEIGPLRAAGVVTDDTLLTLSVAVGNAAPDTQRIALPRGTLLPNVIPLILARPSGPRIGDERTLSVFDPMALAPKQVTVRVTDDSLFVLPDSAARDARGEWRVVRSDTLRAWRVEGEGVIDGWIDRQGRMVEGMLLGLVPLRRTTYELAYDAWNEDAARGRLTSNRDIQETTAIAASAPITDKQRIPRLRVVLRGTSLGGFDLDGARQALFGDTLVVERANEAAISPGYLLGEADSAFAEFLASEPLVQSDDSTMRAVAAEIVGDTDDPRLAAERITRWVYDSLEKRISFSVPDAMQVLRLRAGDCNEHTQLYVALARAAGIPARSVAGLAYVRGKFYYHAWPEIHLGEWIPVDPTFGQFPADAAHLRFVTGGFTRQAELLRLIGSLEIDVVEE